MKEFLKFLLFIGGIAAAILGMIRATKVDEILATDDRMAPTILAGESVFLWRGARIELGDIAVCANPIRPGELVMGRVIGLAGAQIAADRRGLTVNGRPPDRDSRGSFRFPDPASSTPVSVRWGLRVSYTEWHQFMVRDGFEFLIRPTLVPAGKAYLLADYESATSLDSRTYGTVDVSSCLGTVFMRWKPSPTNTATEAPLDHGYLEMLD